MAETFTARLDRRRRLWWERPTFGGERPLRDGLHRLRERRTLRSRGDAEEAWRCCPSWPRTLVDKWNGREFALRHGCAVPEVHWQGRAGAMPGPDSLPDDYVVRPVRGERRRGVLVVAGGRELLRGEPLRSTRARVLIEQLVRHETGADRLPAELKCHTFGAHVAAIEVVNRTGSHADSRRYYTAAWEPFDDPMYVGRPAPAADRPAPAGLAEMVAAAERLGAAIGTYMRIDFFAGEGGCVFNEFSSVPLGGRRQRSPDDRGYTPFCDELFGRLWEREAAGTS